MILHFFEKEALREMKIHLIAAITSISILTILFTSATGFADQTYKVLKGDTLYRIGKMFNTNPEAIKELNSLKNDNLSIGQILKVPAEQQVAPVKTTQTSAKTVVNVNNSKQPQVQQLQPTRNEPQTYKVHSGDTLSGIARSFNISLNKLIAANKISNSNKIKIGQILTIPGENKTASLTSAPVEKTSVLADENSAHGDETSAPAAAVMRLANQMHLKPTTASEGDDLTVRDRLVEAGFNMLGVRYRFGGTSEKTGFDCSGLVKNLFEKFNLTLPRSSSEQYKQGEKVAKEDLQKGDLLFFSSGGKTPTHVGIYIGDNQFLHAASQAKKVIISDLSKTWYGLRYLGARRIMELWWGELKTSVDNSLLEWTHELLNAFEDTQIPLSDVQLEEFVAPIQYDATYENYTTSSIHD